MADQGVDLKLARAKQHMELLKAEMAALYGPGVGLDHSVLDGGLVHAYAVQGLPPVPTEWSTRLGTVSTTPDRRSTMGVRGCPPCATPVNGPGGTTFPIISSGTTSPRLKGLAPIPTAVEVALKNPITLNSASGFVGLFGGVLSELDNRDKHRRLLVQYTNNEWNSAWGGEPTRLDRASPWSRRGSRTGTPSLL